MSIQFTQKEFAEISNVLGAEYQTRENEAIFTITNKEEKRQITLSILPDVDFPDQKGNMLIINTGTSHMQMHNCLGYVASEMLNEVAFISESEGNLSGVIIEKGAGVTIYCNIHKDLLSADFTALAPEVMMAGISLSLADHLLPE